MKNTIRFLTLAGLVVVLASPLHAVVAELSIPTRKGDSFILQPKPATGPVVNPGKGWIRYNFHSKPDQTPPEALAIGSLGYTRYNIGGKKLNLLNDFITNRFVENIHFK